MIKIREAKKEDVNSIYQFGKEIAELGFSKKFAFHQRKEIEEGIKNKKYNILLVAEEGKEIVGFLFAKILSNVTEGWCMLDNLAVKKQFRKHGVGSQLLHELYEKLKKRKIKYIQILEAHHKKTRKFWKDKGFKETKTFVWAEKTI